MKIKHISSGALVGACMFLLDTSNAASQISFGLGILEDLSGDPVEIGTWIIVVDSSGINSMPGGLTYQNNNTDTLTASSVSASASHFSGLELSVNEITANNIIAAVGSIGSVNGIGTVSTTVNFIDGFENTIYAVYWFPGFSPGQTLPTTGTFTVGGFVDGVVDAQFAPTGTRSPLEGQSVIHDFVTDGISPILVTAIPEPSTFLLSTLGAIALLRRSRKS